MSGKLIIAAAGAGKTTKIVKDSLKINDERVLITTFTEANEQEIINKFYDIVGFIPHNITIQTWFSFLIENGVKPYQSYLYEGNVNGMILVSNKSGLKYMNKYGHPVYYCASDVDHYYLDPLGRIYSDKLAKFVYTVNEKSCGLVLDRLVRLYPNIFIDEVQDMAGYDFEIIRLLSESSCSLTMVGDPRQTTYHTHEEAKNRKYSSGEIKKYIKTFCPEVEIDDTSLNKTYRNNKIICEFANMIYPEYSPCTSLVTSVTGHDGIFFVKKTELNKYLEIFKPVQLRPTKATKTSYKCESINIGNAKGLTFKRVLIYPTKPFLDWIQDHNKELKPSSRAKLYVAITRAIHSVAFLIDEKEDLLVPGVTNWHSD